MKNVIVDQSYNFAIRIVNTYKFLSSEKKEFILSKQLLKSGTSIGANVTEAQGAISTADFSSKISIAYKECLETKYWLKLLHDTKFIEQDSFRSMFKEADEMAKILFSILKKTRIDK